MASSSSTLLPPTAVRVGVRIRPLTSQEINEGGRRILQTLLSTNSIRIGERHFTFDAVFDAHVAQVDLYDSVAPPLLKSFIDGYNATILAYGQTGSGKTFTMGSEAHLNSQTPGSAMSSGLIPRFMADIFTKLGERKDASDCLESRSTSQHLLDYYISASFLEVYGEDVHDLLDANHQPHHRALPLREDANGGVVVAGLTQRVVNNAQEALQVLHEGTLNRTTAATLMNLTSSRSHAVFTLYVTQQLRQSSDALTTEMNCVIDVTTTSRFTFVDLAGSERMKKTGAEGERAREGIKINEGLLALGNVINALSSESSKPVHVPYRQSKLTRLLQDALGGNSQTFFLACVSPSDTNASETLSTLHYANRARNIKNLPTKNVDASALELQQLRAFTHVLQCELVKNRFQSTDDAPLGQMRDEALMKRSDVVDYIRSIQVASESYLGVKVASNTFTDGGTTRPTPPRLSHVENNATERVSPPMPTNFAPEISPNCSILNKVGDAFLEEVNPDEEMAILDQLLELQHQDHEYDMAHKQDAAKLKQVEGELAEQEALLLQLRDSLKVYHSMKEKFEVLMSEVQQLETEKATLAIQLEKATVDPSKGCSLAIAKKLEKVEQSLAFARTEARKHQQMYRKAEQEAQKCRALERKITQLLNDRVQLMKKQSDAALRHREYTEIKTREIMTLKKKERTADLKVSKLQTQIRMHKKNLDKRNAYCAKLSEKLKQTESHLTKLLTMRKTELDRAPRKLGNRLSRSARIFDVDSAQSSSFAPMASEDVTARRYLLDNVLADRIQNAMLKEQYHERLSAYADVTRQLVSEVNSLHEARTEKKDGFHVAELERGIEDLELKSELLQAELEQLRTRLPEQSDTNDDVESKLRDVVATASAPVARRLLWDFMDKLTESEIERQTQMQSLDLKDSALRSFESEVETLNNKIAVVSSELAKAHAMAESKIDGFETIRCLESEKVELERKLGSISLEKNGVYQQMKQMRDDLSEVTFRLSETNEKLVLAEAIVNQNSPAHPSKIVFEKVQELWLEIGLDVRKREQATAQIKSSLDNTCNKLLEDATSLKTEMLFDLEALSNKIEGMQRALGYSVTESNEHLQESIAQKMERLRLHFYNIQPTYQEALVRFVSVAKSARSLQIELELQLTELSENLRSLLSCISCSSADVVVSESQPPDSLNDVFLTSCEQDVTALRVKKSEIVVTNLELQTKASALAEEMHLNPQEVSIMVSEFVQKSIEVPEWWSINYLESVSSVITSGDNSRPLVNTQFSLHLKVVYDVLMGAADVRRYISTALKAAVEESQKSLLKTVSGELCASEAYSSFHAALFRLPTLSRDLIEGCITELNALADGVETLIQSEIEALTIVWEALSVSSLERGKFWAEVDDLTSEFDANALCPFMHNRESVLGNPDEWVHSVLESAKRANDLLRNRLYKLELIHSKVEQLRTRQDRKSNIIALDSELRILNAKLDEFEDKKCSKQRLLTKKAGSSNLLKEERFRKQMQATFSSKLEHLGDLLRSWKNEERESFDSNLLSGEVRSLLCKPQKVESLVEERTEFMHLRTVKAKPNGKRVVTSPTSARKDWSTRQTGPHATQNGLSPLGKRSAATPIDCRKRDLASAQKRYLSATESSRRFTRSAALAAVEAAAAEIVERQSPLKRKQEVSSNETKTKKIRLFVDEPNALLPTGQQLQKSRLPKITETGTMLPFGHVLSQVSTQAEKENKEIR